MTWVVDAACRGMDPNLFHPERGTPYREVLAAKAVCVPCPVKQQCLDFAQMNDCMGVWGGMSEKERKIDRRRWKREKGIT